MTANTELPIDEKVAHPGYTTAEEYQRVAQSYFKLPYDQRGPEESPEYWTNYFNKQGDK